MRKLLSKQLQEWLVSVVLLNKKNHCAYLSVNHMRADHSSLKASLSGLNIVPMAECECGDGMQTGECILWDCKLYEDQRATIMEILSENNKEEYPNSVSELLRLEEKGFMQGICCFINNIPKFI
jgi:hypothetical protein